ncbi:GNAT family N-acetyltransferase [Cyclobacterium sp. 1_MG-2023]|uniref:GNAT family N-acetyltransferase n=1 Tax=Cyclobacterium sp. 1_MG-2023 TaxID=3062681 RepID=UPI0026E264FB|nr:GNAT family N-acetyltransferase [Cyclobacterium sp. 1_MG-2023]MDO6437013.1 GNAT family N-acetyltransferase [Cyclobacterium sp. 1_MG-2023]
MRKATQNDREKVVTILLKAFKKNKSVNYIAGKEEEKIRYLMEYSFENCIDMGEVFISEDGNACAMIQFQDKKKFSWKSTYLDIQLILKTIGLGNIPKALARESFIKKHYPKEPFTYLWFVGVSPEKQKNGFGTKILEHVLDYSKTLDRPVYLETSTESNLPWYQKHGLEIYTVSEKFGFPFYFLKTA